MTPSDLPLRFILREALMHLARFPLKVHKHHAEGDDQQEGGAEDGLFRPEAHGQIAENGADGEAEDGEEVKSRNRSDRARPTMKARMGPR